MPQKLIKFDYDQIHFVYVIECCQRTCIHDIDRNCVHCPYFVDIDSARLISAVPIDSAGSLISGSL